ncbi:MAG: adenylyltransferase/cytidyltransferase family protein [Paludibacterium sp.]|uniref:PfkB family carbohydrate kinase n=1 Tax=Paludibacterium sp. TaxID=1917523 RepID=UPI0025CE732F|nr:PfkB family carbohydrate kinase [Paludibacterium sp.]MBV8048671.1 adenylyltransferase/cytidyltransferase family protein [Paludibacterium sp.]MBV8645976.1 adenylyltransferase/cytidyltransferase family protein [Paludibacterium sp.]
MTEHKIHALEDLAAIVDEHKRQGRRVVLCHGTFDLMHTGHIRHLQSARRLGDVLVVTLTGDAFVRKGPGRPVFGEDLRAENLAALACVDLVAVNQAETAINVIHALKPSLYVKGSDYVDAAADLTGNIAREVEAVRAHGGDVHFTDEITFSSTSLLNNHFDVFSPEARAFLADFKQQFPLDEFIGRIRRLKSQRVLVVGDAIIDEYHYVSTLGQTGKGNTLAVRYASEERFAGGAIAVANHVAGFCQEVTLLTALGKEPGTREYVSEKLRPNVSLPHIEFPTAQTLIKRRFVDQDLQRLFEVYFGGVEQERSALDHQVCQWLAAHAADYDTVIVPDFGNGMISRDIAHAISTHARFLAVNTQINSGNRGYHVITRYPRADFLCLNEPEARLAAHDRLSPLEMIASELNSRLSARATAITRGSAGALLVGQDSMLSIPALSSKVVDRIGAGDAFLSLAGTCMGAGEPPEIAVLAGSISAALDVQIVCNREPVDPVLFCKYATTLLK